MLDWLDHDVARACHGNVTCVKLPDAGEDLKAIAQGLNAAVKSARGPLWIFGTTFHYLPLIDAGLLPPFPAGSLVFHTGGTKGRVP
jgi:hypothetical protein